MNIREHINLVKSILREDSDPRINYLILKGGESGFYDALELKYGDKVPLYHATTPEKAEIIDKVGLKPVMGKNYKSFSHEDVLYFQIGKSDYVSSERSVLYRWDAPLSFISQYATIDLDNVNIRDRDLEKMGIDIEYMDSDSKDVIAYYVWNNYSLEGMELLVMDIDKTEPFPEIKPVRVN